MKTPKKTTTRKAVINSTKDRKSKTKTPNGNRTQQEIETQKVQNFIEECHLEKRIEGNFMEEEKKYRDEISELFSVYPELTPDNSISLFADQEGDIETLKPTEIPFFQVFMFDQLKSFGKERVFEEGYYEIDELIEYALREANEYCSPGEEEWLDKLEKMARINTKTTYKHIIINYAISDFRLKKMLSNMDIRTQDALI